MFKCGAGAVQVPVHSCREKLPVRRNYSLARSCGDCQDEMWRGRWRWTQATAQLAMPLMFSCFPLFWVQVPSTPVPL